MTFVRGNERRLVIVGLVIIALVTGIDIAVDIRQGLPLEHLIHELTILIFCILLVSLQTWVIVRKNREIKKSALELASIREQREDFKRKSQRFSSQFHEVVYEQFRAWDLTESEQEIAILLVKGLSMKEIALDRSSKEATVRQQAMSIYKKSRLEGRNQLTAFFLEDLFSVQKNPEA